MDTLQAATAELARVVDVDLKQYTCTLQTENTNKPLSFVPFASPYCNNPEGEGMTFVPEVGSQAILLQTNEGPVVIGFVMTPGQDLYRGNRPLPKPGDIFASTRDGNFLHLHRGGVVQIGATPTTQRLYIPIDRLIRDICQGYHLETFGGSLTWEVESRSLQDPGALFTLRGYELVTDKDASVVLKIGKAFESADARKDMEYQAPAAMQLTPDVGYIELEINKAQADRKLLLRVDKGGNEFLESRGGYERRYRGKCFVRMDDDFSQTVGGGMSLGVGVDAPATASGSLNEEVLKNIDRKAGGTMTDTSTRRVIEAGTIQLGSSSASQPAVLGLELATWLATHVHPPNMPPEPSSLARLRSILSKKVRLD